VNGNLRSLKRVVHTCEAVWHKWLKRRSQRSSLSWPRFKALLRDYPLPTPRVVVRLWQPAP
jgi:hypothetical protein